MLLKASLLSLLGSSAVSAQLHSLALRAGLDYFGTALDERYVSSDTTYRSIYTDASEFGQFVPENGQKWANVQPSRGSFSYSQGDIVSAEDFNKSFTSHSTNVVAFTRYPMLPSRPIRFFDAILLPGECPQHSCKPTND